MKNKETKRLEILETKVRKGGQLTTDELLERHELKFKRNKQNVFMRLSGHDKYYYASQCWEFTQNIITNGFQQYKAKDIESISIVNCQYYGAKINARLVSGGETHLKTFNDKKEMLGFIVGFNTYSREVA